ncbi:hypothetical protein [Ochrobactrum sp. Marseille-Q0166]|uniref:hypothetical protein n=1 Tax=Ochrobactrum sp. Marseille-Q0166 TaxID=2761105 RepID=UPI0016556789|nr:hypothetical protein [Ochrobactrum sp. Marseille-Q0166]MBC8717723.1 hypothetical protein [Ochrobactrum sp. Marseille-Q0166]
MYVQLKGLHTVKKKMPGGTVKEYYYAWRGGPRLTADPIKDRIAFIAEFNAMRRANAESDKETLAGLIERGL